MAKSQSSPTPAADVWLNAHRARLEYGLSRSTLLKLAAVGEVRTNRPPGQFMTFSRADVARIAAARSA
jgi:hypothetical protein